MTGKRVQFVPTLADRAAAPLEPPEQRDGVGDVAVPHRTVRGEQEPADGLDDAGDVHGGEDYIPEQQRQGEHPLVHRPSDLRHGEAEGVEAELVHHSVLANLEPLGLFLR